MERFAIKIDKTLRANLYKICRLCGIDNPDKIKVRDDANTVNLEDGEPELWKKVFDCIGLMITKDDKMPQFMCTLCVDKINDFFEFREMCYATDGQTRKLLGIKGDPKAKVPASVPSSSVDFKTEDIKESIPEITPLRAGRKRRNADLDICKDIKTDETEDIKPSTTNVASNVSKKKRIKLSNITETDTKIDTKLTPVNTKKEPASKVTPVNTKKEPANKLTAVNTKKEPSTKVTPKVEPPAKIALSKKRLKTEPPPVVVKENKKEIKTAKITKFMKKKLKLEAVPVLVPEEQQQQITRKKKELIKLKKLPQVIIKTERLRKSIIEAKIKEETPVAPPVAVPTPAPAPSNTKTKSKPKEKCTICNEGFVNKAHLDKHVKATHIPTVQRYHCVQCNETLKKNMEIKNHNLWHKLSKTPFQCGKCSETSCSIYTYSKHIRDCNSIAYLDSHIPDWHCPDCSGNYETTYLFNIHSCVSKGLVCPGCEKSLKWKEDYFKHIPTCPSAFHRIPPYMTSNVQVKNEAELPTSPVPPLTTMVALPVATIVTVQSTPSTRITPPQMDSTQCVVIPGNISLHEEPGSSSPSKISRKGKRITKKDLKRFDKLLKSTMTTLVSIKHEPPQGVEAESAVADSEQPSSSDVIEPREPPLPPQPDSPPGSPMACGGGDDDFHHNGDDSDSADEQTPSKPVGTIKQEIIDEGYRDLYNNIEVNIKHEIEVNKNVEEQSPQKKTTAEALPVSEEATTLAPKPILKLKITKEHGTLNSILMDSPKSEKKKKKKKRKEDRVKSPDKEGHGVADDDAVVPPPPVVADVLKEDVPVEKDVPFEKSVPTTKDTLLGCNKTTVSDNEEEPAMPLPGIIRIKKEITEPAVDETDEEASSQNTPSIVASSSGSLQISCVSEGVNFHGTTENEEEMPQETAGTVNEENEKEKPEEENAEDSVSDQANLTSEESANWAEPTPSMELSLSAVSSKEKLPLPDSASTMQFAMTQEAEEEEIDIKPRLEDLIPIPMLQITSVTSGAEVIDKPVKTPVKRRRRPTVAKPNPMPKIVSVSSGTEVASYHPPSNVPSVESAESIETIPTNDEDAFDFSQIKIKEEIVDPGYYEESSVTAQQDEEDDDEEKEEEAEEEAEEAEEEEDEEVAEEDEDDEVEEEADDVEVDDEQIKSLLLKKQADENAYIANIDFNNLTIKQEKEYIDDGLEHPPDLEEDVDEEDEDACSDNESEDVSSDDDDDDDSNKSDSESEREYRDLPSEDDEKDTNDENAQKITEIPVVMENKSAPSIKPLGLQILTVHSEFSCPESDKKTESKEINSNNKLSLNATIEGDADKETNELTGINEQDNKTSSCSEEQTIPMETDKTSIEPTDSNEGEADKESIELADINKQVNKAPSCSEEQEIPMNTEINKGETDKETIELTDINEQLKKTSSSTEDPAIPMEVDVECESMHEDTFNDGKTVQVVGENQSMFENTTIDEASVKIFDRHSLQQTQSENIDPNESSNKFDFEMSRIESAAAEEASVAQINYLDRQEKEIANPIKDAKSNLELQKPSINSAINLENTNLPQVCDDLETKANEQMEHNPSFFSTEGQCDSDNFSTAAPSQESVLERNILDRVLYPAVSDGDSSTSRLLPLEGIANTNTFSILETQNVAERAQVRIESEPSGSAMMSMDQSYDTALQPISRASTLVHGRNEGTFGHSAGQIDISERDTQFAHITSGLTSDSGMLSTFTNFAGVGLSSDGAFGANAGQNDISGQNPELSTLTDLAGVGLSSHCQTQQVPLTRLVDTHQSCQAPDDQQLCDSQPPVYNAQQNSSFISTPVQSGSHLRETLKSALSFSIDDQIRYNEGNKPSEHTLQTNSSLTANHTPNAFENTNILMELGNAMGNSISNVDPSSYHDRQEFNPNSQQLSTAAVYNNIPTPSPMELHQFNMPGSSYATFNCNNDPSRFTEYQDLTPPTAGQLQTSLVHQPSVNQSSSELSTNSLTNLSVLSEEVQNLLNEDTVAINNFEYNDNVLRVRASAAPINPVPVFNDFENLNEIAENNNNANIERELQDELGNVLADAIADRSNDDADDDNVMNENRANFDIT